MSLLAERAIMGMAGKLPKEYQKVNAVKFTRVSNTSGTRVNTEVLITSNRIKIIFDGKILEGGGRTAISNYIDASTSNGIRKYGAYLYVGNFGGTHTGLLNGFTLETYGDGTGKIYDSTRSYNLTYGGSVANETPVCIGATAVGTNDYRYTNEGPYRRITLYIDGVKVFDMVPCYRKVDTKYGLYDLCGNICSLTNTPFFIEDDSRWPILPYEE